MKTRFGDIQIATSERFSCHPNGFGISPYLQEKLVFLGQFEVYQQASEMAQTRLGILIGPSQIDRLTRYYGAAIADPLEQPVTTNEPASEVVYAQVDGAMLLTEEGYKEAKLGHIFTASSLKESPVDERGGYITSSLFVAHIGTVAQFSPKFDAQLEPHTSRGANLVFISDGAVWLRQMMERSWPKATLILDLYHTLGHINEAGSGAFGTGKRATSWLDEQRKLLLASNLDCVLVNSKDLRIGSADLTASQWQGIEKLILVKRKSVWPLQQIVETIFYVTKNGVVWRDLPEGFPAWQTVYWYASPVVL